jgi:hypothetical protein
MGEFGAFDPLLKKEIPRYARDDVGEGVVLLN